jgi:hypothetical protein
MLGRILFIRGHRSKVRTKQVCSERVAISRIAALRCVVIPPHAMKKLHCSALERALRRIAPAVPTDHLVEVP